MIRTNVNSFATLYKQYTDAISSYNELETLVLKFDKRINVSQLREFDTITIEYLSYTYPTKIKNLIPFSINIRLPIQMVSGQIIRLVGETGDGKSTFMDIICGIIPHNEIVSKILYNNIEYISGFDTITNSRFYVEQFEMINWNPSPFEIITGKYILYPTETTQFNIYNLVDIVDEDLVWKAIEMAQCLDFIKRYNEENDLKWIHLRDINPSGGQRGRIRIARIIYNILKQNPKLIVLDEVDTAFQGKMGISIMTSIFDYCRLNRIICLVSAHSTEVKQLSYDAHIYLRKGLVSLC